MEIKGFINQSVRQITKQKAQKSDQNTAYRNGGICFLPFVVIQSATVALAVLINEERVSCGQLPGSRDPYQGVNIKYWKYTDQRPSTNWNTILFQTRFFIAFLT